MYNISTFRLCNLIKYQLISKDTLCIVLSKFHQKYVQNLKNKLYNFIIINIHSKKLSKSCYNKNMQQLSKKTKAQTNRSKTQEAHSGSATNHAG
jgi:hypothetical protein